MDKENDVYTLRTGNAEKKAEFKERTRKLKEEKNISQREIYEAGLKVYEKGNSEAQILNRRNKTIAERDTFFNLFIERNKLIIAYNRQLRNKNKRYKDYTDEKDVINVFDEEGRELDAIPNNQDKIKYKQLKFWFVKCITVYVIHIFFLLFFNRAKWINYCYFIFICANLILFF